jgi:FAD/FMN-containing dehydrogenase
MLRQFAALLKGRLILPDDQDYDTARRVAVSNPLTDKHPALIVRCAEATDVVRAIEFAHTHSLEVAVRGGGHDILGMSVCDGGLVIDLTDMKRVEVDPQRRMARAEAGLITRELHAATHPLGLVAVLGDDLDVGISGLTLGGGLGWLAGTYGAASDNLVSVELVTADGRRLVASEADNADLFWGVRGGGGNFGVVTALEYQLRPVTQMLAGWLLFPSVQAREVFQYVAELLRTAPDELTVATALSAQEVGMHVLYWGEVTRGEEVVQPLRSFMRPAHDSIQPLTSWFNAAPRQKPDAPPAYYWKGGYVHQVSAGVIDTMLHSTAQAPPAEWWICSLSHYIHGALCRREHSATAFNLRDDGGCTYYFGTSLAEPTQAHSAMAWVNRSWEALQPFSGGRNYVNYLSVHDEAGVKSAYSANYPRLVALKKQYDPTNFFHLNRNIRPSL